MQETWVRPLGQEDPLEKGMATHSSILIWRISWTEETGGDGGAYNPWDHRVKHYLETEQRTTEVKQSCHTTQQFYS